MPQHPVTTAENQGTRIAPYKETRGMKKKSVVSRKLLLKYVKRVRITEILPFYEQPSIDREKTNQENSGNLQASELFSLFTADIIKKDVLFTR